jgi:FkbM family methyltransferase
VVSVRPLARAAYYVRSVGTLLRGMPNLPRVLAELAAGRPPLVRVAGGYRFRVRTALDVWMVKEVVLDREYERAGVTIAPGWTVVDGGAAHGEFAIPAARVAGRVIAVEPAPETFDRLVGNLALNATENVTPLCVALGDRDGTATLALSPRGTAMHSTAVAPRGSPGIAVPMITLATLFERAGVAHCDCLKLDCEGAEYAILAAASDAVLARVARVVLEYHEAGAPGRHRTLVARLRAAGFEVRALPSPVAEGQGWIYATRRTHGSMQGSDQSTPPAP